MRSLRAQVLALVVAAVLVALVVFALLGTRTANVQFRAIIASTSVRKGESLMVAIDTTLVGPAPGTVRIEAGGTDSSGRHRVALERRVIAGAGGDTTVIVRVHPGDSLPPPAVFDSMVRLPPDVERAASRYTMRFSRALWLAVPVLLGVAGLLALLVTGRLLGPIRRLTTAAQGIAAGDYGTRVGVTEVTELTELAHAFDRMAEGLERSEASRRQVMRDLAHELRTPLTNLRAQIEALQDGLRPADGAALASLHEEATVLERLVGDVDVLARADAGRLDMHVEACAVAPVVQGAVEGFVRAGRLDPSRVRVHAEPGLAVRADRQRLAQVLRNLVDNALRHGGDAVTLAISTAATGDTATITVADTGVGIPAAHVGRVFDRLYRVDPSRTRATGGSGLGLSIVQALVEAQGGRVGLTSVEGQGTTVTIELPRVASGE